MVKKLRKEHRIITYLNQTNDQLSTRYVLVFSSIILRVSPINVIDTNKYELFPPCNILFDTLLLRCLCKSSIQKVTVCNILFDTLLLRCLCKSFDTEGHLVNVDTNQRPPSTDQNGSLPHTWQFTGTQTKRTCQNKVVDKEKRQNSDLRTASNSMHTEAEK